MDAGAAARLQHLFRTPKAAGLPIYLHSPGGDVRQGIAMGRLLRERKATSRGARTLVKDCGADRQDDAECLKLKQSGRELDAELTATGAFCNSSCAYLLFGATVREVAPDVTLGVHSARVTISYSGRGRVPSQEARELATRQALARLDRDIAGYVEAMGIERGLLDLVRGVKFEQMHTLKRDELFRFGIDRREFVETPWRFVERGERAFADKLAQERDVREQNGFRTLRWRLSCLAAPNLRLDYARTRVDESIASVVIRFGADQKIVLGAPKAVSQVEARAVRVDGAMVEKLKAAPRLSLMEVGDTTQARETVVSTEGLSRAIDRLSERCGRS